MKPRPPGRVPIDETFMGFTPAGATHMYPIEMPRSGRVVSAVLGALFLALGVVVLATSGGGGWKPVVGGIALLALALDFLISATRGKWPVLAPWLLLA